MLQMAELRYEHADAKERDRHRGARSAISPPPSADDLGVAEQRSMTDDEKHLIREIRPLVARWRPCARSGDIAGIGKARSADRRQVRSSDRTQHRSQLRRPPPDRQQYRELTNMLSIGATLLALLLAGAITLFLRSRIVRPLAAAATVADRIASGELQTAHSAGRRRRNRRPAQIHDGDAGQYPRDDDARDRAAPLGRKPAGRTRWRPRAKASFWWRRTA